MEIIEDEVGMEIIEMMIERITEVVDEGEVREMVTAEEISAIPNSIGKQEGRAAPDKRKKG
jgi:hypothetical protein